MVAPLCPAGSWLRIPSCRCVVTEKCEGCSPWMRPWELPAQESSCLWKDKEQTKGETKTPQSELLSEFLYPMTICRPGRKNSSYEGNGPFCNRAVSITFITAPLWHIVLQSAVNGITWKTYSTPLCPPHDLAFSQVASSTAIGSRLLLNQTPARKGSRFPLPLQGALLNIRCHLRTNFEHCYTRMNCSLMCIELPGNPVKIQILSQQMQWVLRFCILNKFQALPL